MAKTTEEIKELLATELFRNGIAKKYIVVNEDSTIIYYNCKNRAKRRLQNPEEFVQATSFLKLIFDYGYLPQNISVNESVQVGSETKEADILVYNEKNNKIQIVVECKEESTNERQFQVAADQAYSYAHALAATYIWITSGIKNEYFELSNLYPVERIAMSDIPKRDGEVQRYKYVKGEHDPLKGTQGELIQKFKSAHDALWGGGEMDEADAFDEMDKLIFCKIWDERWDENNPRSKGEPYDFQIIYYPEDKEDKSNLKAKAELEKRIQALYNEGRKKDPEVFKEDIKINKHKIFTVVQYLQDIHLSNTDLDAKGLAFQTFMGSFFKGKFGAFFTPNAIVQFIVNAIGIKKDYKVLDTSCGSGGFLIHALKAVREEANEIYGFDKSTNYFNYWHNFAQNRLFGIEINGKISRVAKMNMIIHDDGHTNVITNDGLKNNRSIEAENRNLHFQDGTFDLIMTNPPFGSTIKADEVDYYKEYELFEKNLGITELKDRIADDNNRNKWRPSQSTEILFLERCHKYLKEGGYLAIVIPDGILTNSTSQYVRDWLIEKFRVITVVSLPQHTFSHVGAGVKSSILFLKKHPEALTKQMESILINIKAQVRDEKGLDKEAKEERILELYKEQIFKYINDYITLMFEIENVGYDAVGKKIEGGELNDVSARIQQFIIEKGL
ncbi:MAG: N-6 DNA methylase [Prevotellaceae bacterium]|jgi:type I restriction enzyme M protein|nr:N-6 DNA methylase [Prevotellaceae bacterium]